MTLLLAAVYDGGRSFVPAILRGAPIHVLPGARGGSVGDGLGIAVEFVDEIPRQERLREFDAGRIHVCSMCGLPYVWLISCR
jgi:hypothetical protein